MKYFPLIYIELLICYFSLSLNVTRPQIFESQIHVFKGIILSVIKKAALYFSRKEFCRDAIRERADLGIFKQRLTTPVITGLVLIVASYLIGLPTAVIVGGFVVAKFNAVIATVITTLIYGLSWLLFMLGAYLAGPKYGKAFSRWLVRVILEKMLGDEVKTSEFTQVKNAEQAGKN